MSKPKILVFDIETSLIHASVWALGDQYVGIDDVEKDWHLMSWAAKWLDSPPSEIMYMDQRNARVLHDDRRILKGIWKLLDQADIVITQNGKSFDIKKLAARFKLTGITQHSSVRHIDTLLISRKVFAFTSHKLEYMTDKINKKYKKLKHNKYPGKTLWKECERGNMDAWNEMEKYNKHDVLSTEELYKEIIPWDTSINLNIYDEREKNNCSACGAAEFTKYGFRHTNTGKFQRYKCSSCGAESFGKTNLLSPEKKKAIKEFG